MKANLMALSSITAPHPVAVMKRGLEAQGRRGRARLSHAPRLSRAQRLALAMVLAAVWLAATLMLADQARAAFKPQQPVTFIVMAGKGGGADKAVNFISGLMKKYQPDLPEIRIENIPGRSGADALAEIAKRRGDPNTLMFTLNSFYTAPMDHPDLKVDITKLTPVGRLANDTFVLWVNSDREDIKTLNDFVKAARNKGKGWVMSGTGTGSEDNLLTDFLNAQYGLEMTYQPRKGGGAVAKDLAEGRADSTVNNPAEQAKYHGESKTKPIVAFTPSRLKQYLAIPTLTETGMNFHYFMQRSVVAPEAMPKDAADYWRALFKAIFDSPEWQEYRTKNSLEAPFITGEELRKFWQDERRKHERWRMSLELLKP